VDHALVPHDVVNVDRSNRYNSAAAAVSMANPVVGHEQSTPLIRHRPSIQTGHGRSIFQRHSGNLPVSALRLPGIACGCRRVRFACRSAIFGLSDQSFGTPQGRFACAGAAVFARQVRRRPASGVGRHLVEMEPTAHTFDRAWSAGCDSLSEAQLERLYASLGMARIGWTNPSSPRWLSRCWPATSSAQADNGFSRKAGRASGTTVRSCPMRPRTW
jgi:hypothetical protein